MNEEQLLFVVLAALYGWECACWLRRGAVGFSTWLGSRWRTWHPGALVGNQNGGFILAPPLPPLGTLFVAGQFPLSLSAEGVLAFVATNVNPGWRPAQSGRFLPFEDLREIRARGAKVLANGGLLIRCSSPERARQCVEQLQALARLKADEREAALAKNLDDAFDVAAVERLRQEFQTRALALRGLSNGLLGYVFAVVPAVIWHFGFKSSWLGLLAGLLALTGATAFFLCLAHRALYPKAEDERFTHTLTILLAPTSAMRAHDALSRPLMEGFHPLTVAKVLLPEAEFREFARRVLLDIRQPALPLCPNDELTARETERRARAALQAEAETFLKATGVKPEKLCPPPKPADETCRAYCARCEAQFTTADGTCADCGGLARKPFGPAGGAE